MEYEISYAQNREDIILSSFFEGKNDGFYVDVGASHPVKDSVTKYFYNLGWSGVNIEPNKSLWPLLNADRQRDINLNIGVGDKNGPHKFREYTGDHYGLSTLSQKMMDDYEKKGLDYKDYDISVSTLAQIFSNNGITKIDLLKVDAEGYEYEILSSNDWELYRPTVLCVEANHIVRDWRQIIKSNKYTFSYNDGLNEYYIANEKIEIKSNFSYPERLLLGSKIIDWDTYCTLMEVKRERKNALYSLHLLQQKYAGLEYIIFHQHIAPQTIGVKGSLKQVVKAVSSMTARRIENLKNTYVPRNTTPKEVSPLKHYRQELMKATYYGYGYRYRLANFVYRFIRRISITLLKAAKVI